MANKILAFDLGSQRVVGARFNVEGPGNIQLEAYDTVEMLGDPAADSSRVQQIQQAVGELVDKLKAKGVGEAFYAMSGQSVFTRFIKLPPLGDDNVEKMVTFEAQQNVPFPMNEVVWDYQFTGETKEGEIEALLVAIKADSLNEYNDAVSGSGLKTGLVDIAPMALYNAFRYSYADVDEPTVVIDIGARSTNFLYFDNGKFFTRTIPVGGSQITSSIAKEFRVPFAQAEELKLKRGFVSLGGAYADHEDPEVAAMSKVIRNTLGRLHTELGRTTNVFRSQQGGRAPKRVLLSGGSVALPYLREFFEEKLSLPVEYFNPLRKVAVGSGVDGDKVGADAHSLGEVVGLALRSAGTTPVELDLVPYSVGIDRDAKRRKPFLILSTLGLMGLLGAGILYCNRGTSFAKAQAAERDTRKLELTGLKKKLADEQGVLDTVLAAADPLERAVHDRSYWVRLLNDLNNRFDSDFIWYTGIRPLHEGVELTDAMSGGGGGFGGGSPFGGANAGAGKAGDDDKKKTSQMVDAITVTGLYRAEAGQAILPDHVKKLRSSPFLNLPPELELNEILLYAGSETDEGPKWAYGFQLKLPLQTERTQEFAGGIALPSKN